MNILFVCTANTCRSPIAHGIFEKMLKGKKGDYIVSSAGLYAHPNEIISEMAQKQLEKRAIDFGNRKSVQLTKELIDDATLIFSMTDTQRRWLVQSFPDAADRIHLLGDYTNRHGDIDDPYGQKLKAYNKCANDIEEMLNILYEMI
jgi:protein-tyrosine-phosphatase